MPLTTWLKKTQLKRVERKLRRLRARQRQLRDKTDDLKKDRSRGTLAPEEYQRREKTLHDEREAITKEVNHLVVEEERLKAELKAAGASPATS
jgi:peptidoglycan hydrolase CwlO-like protein